METIASDSVDVILRDGSTLRLRRPGPDDTDALLEFFAGLSDRSRYLRFHGVRTVEDALVRPYSDPERGSLVGTIGERIVAVAEYARLRDPRSAEVAFAVADDLQGRGVGTRLLEQLALRAKAAGIDEFVAEVMHDNDAMLHVFRDAGFEVTRAVAEGEVEVRFPIAPTERFHERVAERDHVAVVASLQPFFPPRSVAVIGAS